MRPFTIFAALTALLAGPVTAQTQTFAMTLGDRQLGTLTFAGNGTATELLSQLDNTPLGVADGTFSAASQASDGDTVSYRSESRGGKTRDITVARASGVVTAVSVTPVDEGTELSDPASVPANTQSPAEVFGVLANGTTCPDPLMMYDGRRVVEMATTAMAQTGDTVACDISYRVVLGKGHLSPFNFKSLAVKAFYTQGALSQMTVRAGGFDVNLIRR